MSGRIRYSIIIPAFNEELVIRETYRRLTQVMKNLGEPYELIFVNDGSRDRTESILAELSAADKCVRLLNFSRNFGHQIAITAGIDYASGDAAVIIDADLQDPPEVIPLMIDKWRQGYEVVYARRARREGETFFKKCSAAMFYRVLRSLTDVDIPLDTGDFRLMDRKVCEALRHTREQSRFIRGLVSWAGFRQTSIEYVRQERFAGKTKYTLAKMIRFSADGITSFSHRPLKLASKLGLTVTAAGLIYLFYLMGQVYVINTAIPGWAPIAACLILLNGVVLISLGIMGEYVGRIYDETRHRPLYILREQPKTEKVRLREVKSRVE